MIASYTPTQVQFTKDLGQATLHMKDQADNAEKPAKADKLDKARIDSDRSDRNMGASRSTVCGSCKADKKPNKDKVDKALVFARVCSFIKHVKNGMAAQKELEAKGKKTKDVKGKPDRGESVPTCSNCGPMPSVL